MRRCITRIICCFMIVFAVCIGSFQFGISVKAESDQGWGIHYDEAVPEEIIALEEELLEFIPEKVMEEIQSVSSGVSVYVLDRMPERALKRIRYDLRPFTDKYVIYFANNTAFVMPAEGGIVIAHHLDDFDAEAEEEWNTVIKPECEILYGRFQSYMLEHCQDQDYRSAAAAFFKDNLVWIFLNCRHLARIATQIF